MIEQLTSQIYFSSPEAVTDRPLLGLVSGSRTSLMVDSGTSPKQAESFLQAAGAHDVPPVLYQFLTHWHWDHVFGIPAVGAECIGHTLTAGKLREMGDKSWSNAGLERMIADGLIGEFNADCLKKEMPEEEERIIGRVDREFDERIELDLGGVHCIIEHIGGTHTADSSTLFVPEERVLFAGDCIYGRRFNGEYGYRMDELSRMTNKLKSYDADHYLISHEPPMKRAKLLRFIDRLLEIGGLVGEETGYDPAAKRFRDEFGREPDQEDAEIIRMFTGPNSTLL